MKNQNHTTPNLGETPTEAHKRDAIHIAVAPVKAAEMLYASDWVKLNQAGDAVKALVPEAIGVVDAFMPDRVRPGETFWLMLFPQTITSLRHEWTHPAFDNSADASRIPGDTVHPPGIDTSRSKQWISKFAESIGFTYDRMMRAADDWAVSGNYTRDDTESYKERESEFETFWVHYEIVRNVVVESHESFFTCSC